MNAAAIDRLAGLRVMFGHQSVGGNIVDGVRDVLAGRWPVVDAAGDIPAAGGFMAHGRVGRNGDPRSKTRDFCAAIAGPLGSRVDVALHKYCYADIDAASDVDALFAAYRDDMAALRAARPHVTLVHVTVPLVRVRTGARAWLSRAIRGTNPRVADNARREAFNERLRRELDGEPLFDLAALESHPSRARSLRADYTDDGGHLNAAGRRTIASALLELLAAISRRS